MVFVSESDKSSSTRTACFLRAVEEAAEVDAGRAVACTVERALPATIADLADPPAAVDKEDEEEEEDDDDDDEEWW